MENITSTWTSTLSEQVSGSGCRIITNCRAASSVLLPASASLPRRAVWPAWTSRSNRRHRPILGNNYVTARHPSSMPAIERLFLQSTVPGRRSVTFRPPSGSDIVRHGRPSVPSEHPRGARLGGKSVIDNRQGATVTSQMTHIAMVPCAYESGRVMQRSRASTMSFTRRQIRSRSNFDLAIAHGTHALKAVIAFSAPPESSISAIAPS